MTVDSMQPRTSRDGPIRVLHVIEATLGGTLRYLENIATATQHTSLQLGLAYGTYRADSRLAPLINTVKSRGWQTYEIDLHREIRPIRDVCALLALRRAIQNFKPDIVHCHSSKGGALGRTAAVLQVKRPVRLYSPHALAAPLGKKYLKIEKLIERYTDRFVAVSDSEQNDIVNFGLARPGHVDVVYPLIDSEFFAPVSRCEARKTIGLENVPLVLGMGRLVPQKDPGSFIAIIKRLRKLRPDLRALWLGAGDGEPEFRRQVQEADLESVVQLVPWQHDVRSYIAAANVLLSTSLFESFGYMVAEALSMAVPVVATNVAGTCDIMHGDMRAWLYPVRDYNRATDLLTDLLVDSDKADEIGRQGRAEIVRRFSTEQMRRSLLATYARSLQRSADTTSFETVNP